MISQTDELWCLNCQELAGHSGVNGGDLTWSCKCDAGESDYEWVSPGTVLIVEEYNDTEHQKRSKL